MKLKHTKFSLEFGGATYYFGEALMVAVLLEESAIRLRGYIIYNNTPIQVREVVLNTAETMYPLLDSITTVATDCYSAVFSVYHSLQELANSQRLSEEAAPAEGSPSQGHHYIASSVTEVAPIAPVAEPSEPAQPAWRLK